jgi:NMD protein affecting ribosome stability and mRNA decay
MKSATPAGQFLCPNCGSDAEANIRTTLSVPMVESTHPWDPVFEMRHCNSCGATTPAQLAERWGGIDDEEASRQWQAIFRESSPFKPFYWRAGETSEA